MAKEKTAAESPVLKAIAILKCLAEHGDPIGVQQVATRTGINVSTAHRLLQLMVRDGMVHYDLGARHYGIGTECLRLATKVLGSRSFIGRIRPLVAELAREVDETCAFTLYEPRRATKIVAIVERGTHPLGYDFEIGSRDGLHAGASGKAILAFLPNAEIDRILGAPLPRLTEFTITDPGKLRHQIEMIRKQGYATSGGERIPGAGFGAAAPVFGPDGVVIGSVVVTIPSFRWTADRLPLTARLVADGARRISALADVDLAGTRGSHERE